MKSISVFDDTQKQDAKEQTKSMRDPGQELNAYIQFGRMWGTVGFGHARQHYEVTRKLRDLEDRGESA